jgi:hypothetical protein
MEYLLNSIIIYAAWEIGNLISEYIYVLKPFKDFTSIGIASLILILLTATFPNVIF